MELVEMEYLSMKLDTFIGFETSIIKLQNTKTKDVDINIIKLFSDYRLSDAIPSSKLILDEYSDSYYKLYKESIQNQSITKTMYEEWIKDIKIPIPIVPFFRYVYSMNVVVFYIYVDSIQSYILLIVSKTGDVNVLTHNKNITSVILKNIIEISNDFIKDTINKHLLYSVHKIELFENNISLISSVLTIPTDSKYNIKKKGPIDKFFKNLFAYVRVVDEYTNENEIVMKYKRVSNYETMNVINSVITSLTKSDSNIVDADIIEILENTFTLSNEDATTKLKEYRLSQTNESDVNSDKSIYYTSEPGPDIILSKDSSDFTIHINDCKSRDEFDRIIILCKSFISFLEKYKNDELNDKILSYFNKQLKYIGNLKDERVIQPINKDLDFSSSDEDDLDLTHDSTSSSIDLDNISSDSSGGQSGGAGYYITRLKQKDPKLIKNYNLKSDNKKNYTSVCQASDDRLPIVVNDEELDRINKSKDKGSGKESYGMSIKTGSTPDNQLNYICPKYWDIGQRLSLNPKERDKLWKSSDIISKTTMKTTEGIIERRAKYWKNVKSLSDYQPRKLESTYPDDSNMVCCSLPKSIKEIEEPTKISRTITNCGENKYCIIDKTMESIFLQNETFLYDGSDKTYDSELFSSGIVNQNKKYVSGFVRKGIYDSSIIGCILHLQNNSDIFKIPIFDNTFDTYLLKNIKSINTKYLSDKLYDYIIKSLESLRTKTIKQFKINNYKKILDNELSDKYTNIDKVEKDADIKNIYNSLFILIRRYINKLKKDIFVKSIIEGLKKDIHIFIYVANGLLFNIFKPKKYDESSFTLYIKFMKQYKETFQLDDSIIDTLHYDTFIKTLQTIDYKYKYMFDLSQSFHNYCDYLQSDIFIDDKYFLPIITEVFSEYKNTTFIIFELINYNTRIKIPLDKFKRLTTKLTFIYKNKDVYEPILFRNNTKKYYSSIEKTSTNKYINDIIDNVVELCNISLLNHTNIFDYKDITNFKHVYLNTNNKVTHIVDKQGYIIPVYPSGILKGDIDKKIFTFDNPLKTYSHTIKYLKKYKYIPTGIIVENDKVVNIVFSNDTYVPVHPESYDKKKHKYMIIGDIDLFTLDKHLSFDTKHIDTRVDFTREYNYEMKLHNIFNQNLSIYIKTHEELRNELQKEITNEIYIKQLKRKLLRDILNKHIPNIVTRVKDIDYDEELMNEVCFDKHISDCDSPCETNSDKCLLKVKEISNVTNSDLLDKLLQKYIELLIMYGVDINDTNNIFTSVNYKIEPYELREMTPSSEYFFSYIEYIDNYLDILFDIENIYIHNETFMNETIFEREMIEHNSINMFEQNSPVIVQNIFGKNAKVNMYDSVSDITSKIIYDSIINVNSEFCQFSEIDTYITSKDTFENLTTISKNMNLGFIYITKKYSNIKNTYEVYLILNMSEKVLDDNVYIIPVVDIIDENDTYLTNVIINDKSAFLLSELKKNDNFINYIKTNKLISRYNVNKIFLG